MGNFYLYGKYDVNQDVYKAIEYFLKAYEFGETSWRRTLNSVANIYKKGVGGVKQSGQKAVESLTRDFEKNDAYNSGGEAIQIYLYGCGEIKPDWRKAFEFANVSPYGGLAPNRKKAIEFYKKCIALSPRDMSFKDKLTCLTETDDE